MAMIRFCGNQEAVIINEFVKTLLCFPSITRINLYSCKSGLLPLSSAEKPLSERIHKKDTIRKSENAGSLSFAEHFILELGKAFRAKGSPFPENLWVVACLGDVKHNNGRLAISKNKREIPAENYLIADYQTGLVQINCSQFLATYQSCLATAIATTQYPLSRVIMDPKTFGKSPSESPASQAMETGNGLSIHWAPNFFESSQTKSNNIYTVLTENFSYN